MICSNILDLAEVQSVASATPMQVGTKKIDERAFFDVSSTHDFVHSLKHIPIYHMQNILISLFYWQLKTSRRTYNFYALDASMAQEWIEKIQACLQ